MTRILVTICLLLAGVVQAGESLYMELKSESGDVLPYAVHLPDSFDTSQTYPVLIGPGDGIEGADPGFYWQSDAHSHDWIIVDAQLWENETMAGLDEILDAVGKKYNVEGNKFHAVCWSANSAGVFDLIIEHSSRFHSITGMAGNPRNLSRADIAALNDVKVQFVVGENDSYWLKSAQKAHQKLTDGGVNSVFEIVPDAPHVMVDLIGKPFIQKLQKLRK